MGWLTRGFASIGKVFAKTADAPANLDLRQGSAEFEYFVARAELDNPSGRLTHGMAHLAELLTYDPSYPESLALLEAYLARAGGEEESLLPDDRRNYYAVEAVRAFIFARLGRLEEAVRLLNSVMQAKPDAGYMDAWGPEWLGPPGAVESLPPEVALHTAAGALVRFPEYAGLTHRQGAALAFYIGLVQRVHAAHGEDGASLMVEIGLMRKAGRFDEALARAREAVGRTPDWRTVMALGLTLRSMGRIAEAEEAFRRGLAIDPDNVAANLEIADMRLNRSDWPQALAEYESVLERQPEHPWAHPSALWCRWKMSPDSTLPRELIDLSRQSNRRADGLLAEFRPYAGFIPEPHDALASVLRQIQEKVEAGTRAGAGAMTCRLSSLEAPSNLIAFRLYLGGEVDLDVETIQSPDPRAAIGPAPYALWTYDGARASPALPPPSGDTARQVAAIAMTELANGELWASASRVAACLGEERAADILAVMVYPPAPPDGVDVIEWVQRIQWTAAFVVAHLGSEWEGSPRRDALYSLLFGPRDWATEAAVIALGRLAREKPAIAVDVGAAFETLDQATPDTGFYYRHALYWHWLWLPHLFDSEREELQRKLKALEDD